MPVLLILLGAAFALRGELPEVLRPQGALWAKGPQGTTGLQAQDVAGPVSKEPRRVAINTASPKELLELPGIGPKRASEILKARQSRPFRSASDLRRIKGLGPKGIRRLAPLLDYTLAGPSGGDTGPVERITAQGIQGGRPGPGQCRCPVGP